MYNPYDLVKIKINGKETYGRPVAFDSDPINIHTLKNKDGELIKPILLTSACPDCGQGLEINISQGECPSGVYIECHLCKDKSKIKVGTVNRFRKNEEAPTDEPLLCKNNDICNIDTTVEQRFDMPEEQHPDVASETKDEPKQNIKKNKRSKKKTDINEQTNADPVGFVNVPPLKKRIESAQGLTEEVEIDDADMVELE